MFADNQTILNTKNKQKFSIQEDIESVSNRLVSKEFFVDADKCELMFFGSEIPQALNIQNDP